LGKVKTNSALGFWSAWVSAGLNKNAWENTVRVEKKQSGHFNIANKLYLHQDKLHFWTHLKFDVNSHDLYRYNALL